MRNNLTLFNSPFFRTPSTDLWNEFDEYFKNISAPVHSDLAWTGASELSETDKEYLFSMDLPGVRMEDIKIQLEENVLTITGERKKETRTEENKYHLYEKSYGQFRKSFKLPKAIDTEKVTASMVDGVLEVALPKNNTSTTKLIEITKK